MILSLFRLKNTQKCSWFIFIDPKLLPLIPHFLKKNLSKYPSLSIDVIFFAVVIAAAAQAAIVVADIGATQLLVRDYLGHEGHSAVLHAHENGVTVLAEYPLVAR